MSENKMEAAGTPYTQSSTYLRMRALHDFEEVKPEVVTVFWRDTLGFVCKRRGKGYFEHPKANIFTVAEEVAAKCG